ncbi:MAG: hypothetical protein M3R21_05300, partial [Candidatus Dormibacteraeota bacterium]|nr:hypothetical protein [Candidatus Dormibacteraeota bacterium]
MGAHQPILAASVAESRALQQSLLFRASERRGGLNLAYQVAQGVGIAIERIQRLVIVMLVAESPHHADFTTAFEAAPPARQAGRCSTFYIAGRRVDCHTRSMRKRSALPFGFA